MSVRLGWETLNAEARPREIIRDVRSGIEAVSNRLNDILEWVEQSPEPIIELAPGYTAWLRERDMAIERWLAAFDHLDFKHQCAVLVDEELKAEIDRLKKPVPPRPVTNDAGIDALTAGCRQSMQDLVGLRSRALALVDNKANLIPWSPFFDDLKQAVEEALAECADDSDRVRGLNVMSAALGASGERG